MTWTAGEHRRGARLDGIGEQDLCPRCWDLSDLPQHHGRWRASDAAQLGAHVDLEVHEVPTGTRAFDWTVPREWNIRDAYIKDARGRQDRRFCQLQPACHELQRAGRGACRSGGAEEASIFPAGAARPDPLSHVILCGELGLLPAASSARELSGRNLRGRHRFKLEDGFLTYGEYLHQGETDDEVLLSAHICHPSLANDNCSGLALLAHLANRIGRLKTRYSYRFLFAPGTIGALTWLSRNEARSHASSMGLLCPALAMAVARPTRRAGAAMPRSTGPWRTC